MKFSPRSTFHSKSARRLMACALALALGLQALTPAAWARDSEAPDNDDPGYPTGGPVPIPPVYVKPTDGFTWSAPNRYQLWDDNWAERGEYPGWTPETYNPKYVNPPSWDLYMQGCQEEADFRYDLDPKNNPKPTTKYRWAWNGKTKAFSEDCSTTLDFPAQGEYFVELTVKKADGTQRVYTHPVQVKDFLIVVLGDSSASGEGAPDRPVQQFDGPGAKAEWVDSRCHRSQYAGSAQAAEILEKADPHTSVTFLSFACSGATLITEDFVDNVSIGTGITGGYVGVEPAFESNGDYAPFLPPQTEALWNAVRNTRKVDVLIAAGGINDVHFADIAADCVLFPFCYAALADVLPAVTIDYKFYQDLPNVVLGWEELGQQLDDLEVQGMEIGQRLALEYPPFFHDDDGDMCLQLFEDIIDLPLFEWLVDEIAWADAYWAPDLNEAVAIGSGNAGFTYVSGIAADFFLHGMCADDRYINTATDAANKQGNDESEYSFLAEMSTKGTAHPNAKGYAAYAQRILDHIGLLVENNPPVVGADKMYATHHLPNFMELLANDYDPDPTDTLKARLTEEPKHGKAWVDKYGYASYKPDNGFVGTDTFFYGASDGINERFGKVTVTVEPLVLVPANVPLGGTTTIGDLLGGAGIEGPFTVVLDQEPDSENGFIRGVPGQDAVTIVIPDNPRRRRLKIPYTVYSQTTDPHSPDFGRYKRGLLKIRIARAPR
jgi:hypothetical protein